MGSRKQASQATLQRERSVVAAAERGHPRAEVTAVHQMREGSPTPHWARTEPSAAATPERLLVEVAASPTPRRTRKVPSAVAAVKEHSRAPQEVRAGSPTPRWA
ncbi:MULTISPECIES: hypothetical protein [Actinomycetes]|uniref:hypothetical protein n=1 Tax=Actinomycetes TaxID=1760 RepID=UPI0001B56FA8|nr:MULTISPECIES: hypothetical protein [Actinomycetes]